MVSTGKLWYLFLCSFHLWNWTESYVYSLFWHFSKICQISITNTLTNLCIKFTSLNIRLFYLRLIKKVLTLCKIEHYFDQDGRNMIYFCMSSYLWSNLFLYLEQKFKFIKMVFSSDDTSAIQYICFVWLIIPLKAVNYSFGSLG